MGNPISHWELMVNDVCQAMSYYSNVFDWQFDTSGDYTLIKTGLEPGGGMLTKPEGAPGPALNIYFQVDDVEITLNKAIAAGATMIAPKTEVPGMGYWAMFADPDGIPVGLWQRL